MGKGRIVTVGPGAGQYDIDVVRDISRITSRITKLTAALTAIDVTIATAEAAVEAKRIAMNAAETALNDAIATGTEGDVTKSQSAYITAVAEYRTASGTAKQLHLDKLSKQKEKADLESIPEKVRHSGAWCVDYTTALAVDQDVGTIEINGEDDHVLIQPGGATWAAAMGKLQPISGNPASQAAWNWAMLPGWQKWKPTYRVGTITALDTENDKATVMLDSAESSAQNLSINQATTLTAVPVAYMTCNASAFLVGDEVVVKFEGQDQADPQVIGFASNPRACGLTIHAISELDGGPVNISAVSLHYYEGSQLKNYAYGVDYTVNISGSSALVIVSGSITSAIVKVTPSTANHFTHYIAAAGFANYDAFIAGGAIPTSGAVTVKLPYYKAGTFSRTGITTYEWEGGQELPGGYYGSVEDGFVYKSPGTPYGLPGLSVFMADNYVNCVHKDIYDWYYYALPVTLQVSYSGIVKSASVNVIVGGGLGIYGLRSIFDDGVDAFGNLKVAYSSAAIWEITSNIPALNETFLNPDFAFAHFLQGETEADSGSITITVSVSGGSGIYDHSRMPDGVIDASLGPTRSFRYIKNTV